MQKLVIGAVLLIGCLQLIACVQVIAAGDLPKYKLCVPHHIFDACRQLTGNPSTHATIECVSARDRMECLQLVERRQADFVAVDPEDMHVAFGMRNEDFAVFSELRTREERDSPYRYLGIMLVHKNSPIHSLAHLQGKKSCHTGYGRNVGYKIPITKLKQARVLTISDAPDVSYVEKELQGLSQLFSQSCLVGKYSPNADVNAALKKRYSNLCALCEHPGRCDYPDKYSGYDGAIRCLVENGGDVAFTKVIFVNRFFGLPVGNNPARTQPSANPDDYEYLCADGSRHPVNTTQMPCTWAQRPWQAYMSNADVRNRIAPLQDKLEEFYEQGIDAAKTSAQTRDLAAKMWIDERNVIVAKNEPVQPGHHLNQAQYRDVIERDGHMQTKIRLCVRNAVEQRKCDLMRTVAFSRDIRPEFECVLHGDCVQAVVQSAADVAVVSPLVASADVRNGLRPILAENVDGLRPYVAVVRKSAVIDKTTQIIFDESNQHSVDVALALRHHTVCPSALRTADASAATDAIRVLRADLLPKLTDLAELQLLCPNGDRRPLSDTNVCNFNGQLVGNVLFVRRSTSEIDIESYAHGFVALSDKFGHGAKTEEVFELFDEFEPGQRNVLFGDDTDRFVSLVNGLDTLENVRDYRKTHCLE